jgi:hypothetical protein
MLAHLAGHELRNGEAALGDASPRSTRCAAKYGIVAMPLVRLCSMVAMLPIAGCAGPMGTIHTDTVPTPVVTSFDGTYRSTIRVTKGFGQTSWYDTPGQPVITVANGEFSYATPHPNVPGNPTPSFPATFAPDGTFYGEIISGTISGQVRDTHMEGSIDGRACLYAFTGERE